MSDPRREPAAAPATQSPISNQQSAIPRHIAIIMDGNGRWARERGLPRIAGHQEGAASVRAVTEECAALGVGFLTVYAFSTENWRRPPEEVAALFALLEAFVTQEVPTMLANNVRLRTIGRIHELPAACRRALADAEAATAANTGLTFILALNYSARAELEDAARALAAEAVAGRLDPAAIDQATIARHLYTRDFPDPDLLIRTSGERRLSNFLLWQLSYAEFYLTPILWPDFGKAELRAAIAEFHRRDRRFGGV